MKIKRVGNFYIDTDVGDGLSIGIETSNLASCIEEAKNKNSTSVFGCPSFGFKQSNMDFLSELPRIESIWFWDIYLDNIDGIYNLKHLKSIGIHPKRPGIDFSQLKELERLTWEHNKKDTGIEHLKKVKLFHAWHFNPKSKSYKGLPVPESVQELQIIWSNPDSLEGICVLPDLKDFEIHRSRNLGSIDELPEIAPKLEKLVITTCKKLLEVEHVIAKLPNLHFASINGSILVKDGKLR